MNGKSCHLEQPVAHVLPPMQSTNMSKTTVMEMRRFFNLSNTVSMLITASKVSLPLMRLGEIKSIKMALRVAVGNQPTTETVLHTVMVEVDLSSSGNLLRKGTPRQEQMAP